MNIGANGNVGIGTTNPSEQLEILGGNLKLNRTEDDPTGPRSINFSTKNNAGGSVQSWSINVDPVGRFGFDQHICDLWIGNRVDNGGWDKHLYIERFGNIGLWNMNENPGSKTLYFRNRNNTGGSVQDWAITAEAIPSRYNIDNHICDFWIGNRVIYGDGSGGTWA